MFLSCCWGYYSHIIHYVQDEPSKKKKNNYDISWFPGAERPQQDPTEPSNMRSFQIFMISSSLSATDLGPLEAWPRSLHWGHQFYLYINYSYDQLSAYR